LHLAVAGGHKDVAQLLLGYGATVSAISYDGYAPLHLAVISGNKDFVKLLLAYKADINVFGIPRWPYMSEVVIQDSKDKAVMNDSKDMAESLVEDYCSHGCTPLHLAVFHGMEDMAKLLLSNGADVDVTNNSWETPLHWAARNDYKDIAELLLANKAEINAVDKSGSTPLDIAILLNHMNVADLLRQHGGITQPPKKFFH